MTDSMNERGVAVQAAFAHIVDAASGLTRDQCLVVEMALKAGWLSADERNGLSDLAEGFARLSTAGAV